jgi:hypothetical protein
MNCHLIWNFISTLERVEYCNILVRKQEWKSNLGDEDVWDDNIVVFN